jgi:hypothetical protein
MERMNDLLLDVQINSPGMGPDNLSILSPISSSTETTPPVLAATAEGQGNNSSSRFLSYAPVRIFDPFFASRLNNWRATQLLISLIQDPMWGLYNGIRFVCAVDLCRTHAALGEERNFLGAEKAVGLYLAGVVFGGPQMYEVYPLPFFGFFVFMTLMGGFLERVGVGFGTTGGD